MKFDFSNQTVLIIGGTKGLGRSIGEAFLKSGANVILTWHQDENAKFLFEKDNDHFKNQFQTHQLNIEQEKEVEQFFDKVIEPLSVLDVFVNNSAIRYDQIIGLIPFNEWKKVFDTNVHGALLTTRFVLEKMIPSRNGRIIYISSAITEKPIQGAGAYMSTKMALEGLVKTLSLEVALKGITVNAVAPGFIESSFLNGLREKTKESYKNMIPLRKFAAFEQVTPSVLFLASKESDYITGSILKVAGGL